jgi:hypothetical protein
VSVETTANWRVQPWDKIVNQSAQAESVKNSKEPLIRQFTV